MKLYGLKNCDTCRKALKMLPNVEFLDVRADGVPVDVMLSAQQEFGDALMNTRSTTWRGLDEAARQRPPLDLLKEHPALMKRPLIEHKGALYLGWSKEVQADLGL